MGRRARRTGAEGGLAFSRACDSKHDCKMANGIADNMLTCVYLATEAPVLLAPAMNKNMYAHDARYRT